MNNIRTEVAKMVTCLFMCGMCVYFISQSFSITTLDCFMYLWDCSARRVLHEAFGIPLCEIPKPQLAELLPPDEIPGFSNP